MPPVQANIPLVSRIPLSLLTPRSGPHRCLRIVQAGGAYENHEILDVIFAASDQSSEVVHPRTEARHFPSSPMTA